MRKVLVLMPFVAVVLLMGGCADDDETSDDGAPSAQEASGPTVLSYELIDYGFDGPSEAPVGPATFEITNAADQLHHLTIGKLPDGMTYEQLEAMATAGDAAGVDAALEFYGGVQVVDPDGTARAQVDLDEAGDYALVCFVPAPDGQPHVLKGMIKPFEVVDEGEPAEAAAEPTTEVSMIDFAYTYGAEELVAADQVEFSNDGSQNHEAIVLRFEEGKTKDDLLGYFFKLSQGALGPDEKPPGSLIGGAAATAPGRSSVVELDLEPGSYAMFCAIPNPENNGTPHIIEGMYSEFTVEE
ncbi:MAG TPA: hypothetical protein VJM33_18730 [Microthrixaceae bacterium]|nr:hypothetical protein [Microthrixaceae bacterium]